MNKKILPIGYDDFKKVIDNNAYYVDKTKVIEDLLTNRNEVVLFPRPRRFGKSLLISTLYYFFDIEKKEENKYLFNGLNIAKSKCFKYQGEYPVIRIDFKSLKQDNYNSVFVTYKELIRRLYESKSYIKTILSEGELKIYNSFILETADDDKYKEAIYILTEMLYKYYNKKVIILIDEYDVPIQQGYLKGFYDEIVSLIRSVFSSSLKGNVYAEMSILTGVLRVSKESLFSDVNNIDVYSIVDKAYNEYFGFTEEETSKLLKYYDLKLTKEVKEMYDGYDFNNTSIYNPWSIINYARRRELNAYWVNTSGNELIKDLIRKSNDDIKVAIERLLQGEEIEFIYDDKVTYLDASKINSLNTILNFLFASGYLTMGKTEKNDFGDVINKVKIPNKEIKQVFNKMLLEEIIDKENITLTNVREFNESILNADKEVAEKCLNKILPGMSFMDSTESFYHGFVFGLFTSFLNNKYIIKSNREAGKGRFDLMIESEDRKKGYIIEFKIVKEDNMEEVANIALEQMQEKEYYEELKLDKVKNIYSFAIIFKGKSCIVR